MMETALAFLAGLLIGSFLNVCVYRLPRDLSVVRPRSHCPACEKQIAWYDNIPLVSYVLLRGRCRHCGDRIPLRYPLVELATGAAFALCVASLGWSLAAVKLSLFSAIMIALTATDIEERILPDEFTLGGTALGLVLASVVPLEPGIATFLLWTALDPPWLSVIESATGALFVSGMIWAFASLYGKFRRREVLGLGDVKMLAMIGAFLGITQTLVTLVAASLFGSVIGVPYAFVAKKKLVRRMTAAILRREPKRSRVGANLAAVAAVASRYQLPFGSFLGVAGLAVALWAPVMKIL